MGDLLHVGQVALKHIFPDLGGVVGLIVWYLLSTAVSFLYLLRIPKEMATEGWRTICISRIRGYQMMEPLLNDECGQRLESGVHPWTLFVFIYMGLRFPRRTSGDLDGDDKDGDLNICVMNYSSLLRFRLNQSISLSTKHYY